MSKSCGGTLNDHLQPWFPSAGHPAGEVAETGFDPAIVPLRNRTSTRFPIASGGRKPGFSRHRFAMLASCQIIERFATMIIDACGKTSHQTDLACQVGVRRLSLQKRVCRETGRPLRFLNPPQI